LLNPVRHALGDLLGEGRGVVEAVDVEGVRLAGLEVAEPEEVPPQGSRFGRPEAVHGRVVRGASVQWPAPRGRLFFPGPPEKVMAKVVLPVRRRLPDEQGLDAPGRRDPLGHPFVAQPAGHDVLAAGDRRRVVLAPDGGPGRVDKTPQIAGVERLLKVLVVSVYEYDNV